MFIGPMGALHRPFKHFNKRLFYGKNCAEDASSDKRMLAGGGYVACSCTPAKPLWSEVMIFRDVFLRQRIISPVKTPSRRTLKQVADIP